MYIHTALAFVLCCCAVHSLSSQDLNSVNKKGVLLFANVALANQQTSSGYRKILPQIREAHE